MTFKTLRDFSSDNIIHFKALETWDKEVRKANWNNFSDIKGTFNSVDSVGNMRYVFNVKGNHIRIVAKVNFKQKIIYIRWVGNHNDYDKIININEL